MWGSYCLYWSTTLDARIIANGVFLNEMKETVAAVRRFNRINQTTQYQKKCVYTLVWWIAMADDRRNHRSYRLRFFAIRRYSNPLRSYGMIPYETYITVFATICYLSSGHKLQRSFGHLRSQRKGKKKWKNDISYRKEWHPRNKH